MWYINTPETNIFFVKKFKWFLCIIYIFICIWGYLTFHLFRKVAISSKFLNQLTYVVCNSLLFFLISSPSVTLVPFLLCCLLLPCVFIFMNQALWKFFTRQQTLGLINSWDHVFIFHLISSYWISSMFLSFQFPYVCSAIFLLFFRYIILSPKFLSILHF